MAYIYGNSTLLLFEIIQPTFGYFHGLMLSLSLCMGWASFLIIGNIIQKTIYKIYKSRRGTYKVQYFPFFKVILT
jgi:hypothetical protein